MQFGFFRIPFSDGPNECCIHLDDNCPLNNDGQLRVFRIIQEITDDMPPNTYDVEIRLEFSCPTSDNVIICSEFAVEVTIE